MQFKQNCSFLNLATHPFLTVLTNLLLVDDNATIDKVFFKQPSISAVNECSASFSPSPHPIPQLLSQFLLVWFYCCTSTCNQNNPKVCHSVGCIMTTSGKKTRFTHLVITQSIIVSISTHVTSHTPIFLNRFTGKSTGWPKKVQASLTTVFVLLSQREFPMGKSGHFPIRNPAATVILLLLLY